MRVVMKFGGSSLKNGLLIRRVAEIVRGYLGKGFEEVVVCSAMDKLTDILLDMIEKASKGNEDRVEEILDLIHRMHHGAVREAIKDESLREEILGSIKKEFEELKRAVYGVLYLREATPRSRDYIISFGERLSTRIFCGALRDLGVRSEYLDGKSAGIITDSNFGEANPLLEVTRFEVRRRIKPLLDGGITPVVTGFMGVNEEGVYTTLGRGGSDYTATILGYCLDVDEIWLWSDVDGLMTADPRIVKDARVLSRVSYAEAVEMAMFGAKGLHPRALEPAMNAKIPVRIRNTFNPTACGTLISSKSGHTETVVKCVLLVQDVGMITVKGVSMVGRPGTAARIFSILAESGINIMMISQSVSESGISMIVRRSQLQKAVNCLEDNLLGGFVKEVEAEDDVNVVAIVGEGMKGTPGVASKVFGAVARRGINIRMIAQGSSELNISFVVKEEDGVEAVKAIHEEYGLSLIGEP